MTPRACGRVTTSGSGTEHACELREGHPGAHVAHWIDRHGIRQLGLSWTHEDYQGHAVWAGTPGARAVTT